MVCTRGRRDSQSRPLFEMRRDESLVSVSSQAFPESQSRSRVSKICTSLGLDLVSVSFFHCTLVVVLIWCHFIWKNVFPNPFLVKNGTLQWVFLHFYPSLEVSVPVSVSTLQSQSRSRSRTIDLPWSRSQSRVSTRHGQGLDLGLSLKNVGLDGCCRLSRKRVIILVINDETIAKNKSCPE